MYGRRSWLRWQSESQYAGYQALDAVLSSPYDGGIMSFLTMVIVCPAMHTCHRTVYVLSYNLLCQVDCAVMSCDLSNSLPEVPSSSSMEIKYAKRTLGCVQWCGMEFCFHSFLFHDMGLGDDMCIQYDGMVYWLHINRSERWWCFNSTENIKSCIDISVMILYKCRAKVKFRDI